MTTSQQPLKLAVIGHGAMGRLVEARGRGQGHEVGAVVTSAEASWDAGRLAEALRGHDVAVDFSVAEAVPRNVEACCLAGVPLVVGTTGWLGELDAVRRSVESAGGALIYGANFSIGVNMFYRVAAHAARLLAPFGYEAYIEESHHSRKKDAPSGTALRLREVIAPAFPEKVGIASTRAGHIPGTHRAGFDSAADTVTLEHVARSREGFAAGALLCARWIQGRRGVFEFSQALDEIVAGPHPTT